MNYYNEWDKGAADWLRELIKAGLIPNGYVDERSITEVTPSDLEGFTQCHFFAGVGGWPLALQLAGVPASNRLWTGSPPCQPFSVAGQSLGFDDERHLAPVLLRLVRECKPQCFFGEQVAAAISKHWLDFVFLNLEDKGYSCGAAVLPACSVGAPHKRDRLFFGAQRLGNSDMFEYHAQHYETVGGPEPALQGETRKGDGETPSNAGAYDSVADTAGERLQRQREDGNTEGRQGSDVRQAGLCNGARASTVAHAGYSTRLSSESRSNERRLPQGACEDAAVWSNPHHSFWSDVDWLGCRDGKYRPVESGTFPLANGIPARVGRLRGYGNAIVPQVAAEFIKAFRGACGN
ncbi:DNA cytosine methyltransferase [Pantoea sp. B623]|uniref:DNA cytosine methyltransferase n=1 Tax=Pantoea sp. B623 TaxID=2974561 RepID=UPI002167F3AD|nr:DNA cytosine methyltransferase [Pantoea sp. B623]MCS4496224.1 DNA cytosine methyltransferase [Pantoea sp. B623]